MVCAWLTLGLVGAGNASAASVFYIRGGGYGHGIGMSQYGAYGYALHGRDYRWILGHYYQGTTIGQTNPGQVVRVLIATGSAAFSGATKATGAAPTQAKTLSASSTYTVRRAPGGSALALYTADGKKVGTFSAPLTVSGPGPLDAAGHGLYRGSLELRPSGSGVQTVNAVDLEDYVRGVISAEMPSTWAPEALKAQAVAARTYAITSDVGGNGYQLYPDTRSQVYRGVAAETAATDAAVAATRGQVVTYHGQPVETFFFASSGGHTESIQNVWLGAAPEPWLRGVPDPYDRADGNPYFRWTVKLSSAAARAKLGSLVRGRLIGIRVTRRGVSPRVVRAQVVGTRGAVNVSGPQLQQIFGLMSSYMYFAEISSTTPGSSTGGTSGSGPSSGNAGGTSGSGPSSTSTGGAAPGGAYMSVANPFGAGLGLGARPRPPSRLLGRVFPAARGARATLQVRVLGPMLQSGAIGGWRTIGRVRLGRGGAYSITIRHPGIYRIVWDGLAGPATTVR